jgi:cytochrome b561
MIALIAVGIYMEETETYALYPIHKSVGVLILPFILYRVIWRMQQGWLTPVSIYSKVEQMLSKIVHWVLILGTVLFPVSGMMMSGGGGHGIPLFGLTLLARNPNPENPQEVIPLNETVAGIGHEMHEILAGVMIAAIVLHLIGALKHHFVDKDATLRRMAGKS